MRWILSLVLWSLASGSASAVTLPFEADLVVGIRGGGSYSIGTVGSGVAIANGSGGPGALTSLELPAGFLATQSVVVPVTDPAASPISGLQFQPSNDPGAFAIGDGGRLGGVMALPGVLRVCLFGACPTASANITVPMTPIGAGGTATGQGALNVTVTGAPWTTGTVMALGFGTSTFTGYAQGPASAPSSTARAGGTLQLVTPFAIQAQFSIEGPVPGFAFLTLRFVPEPEAALAAATGLALIAGLWRRRLRA